MQQHLLWRMRKTFHFSEFSFPIPLGQTLFFSTAPNLNSHQSAIHLEMFLICKWLQIRWRIESCQESVHTMAQIWQSSTCSDDSHVPRVRRNPSTLQWRHNDHDGVSNHQPYDCLLNRLFRRRSKKTPKPQVTALCAGNSPVTGEFPAQRASNAENISNWWRHHESSL